MRVVMPLFQFAYMDDEFEFSDRRFSIRRFDPPSDLDKADNLPGRYIKGILDAHWALVADVAEDTKYKEDISLL